MEFRNSLKDNGRASLSPDGYKNTSYWRAKPALNNAGGFMGRMAAVQTSDWHRFSELALPLDRRQQWGV